MIDYSTPMGTIFENQGLLQKREETYSNDTSRKGKFSTRYSNKRCSLMKVIIYWSGGLLTVVMVSYIGMSLWGMNTCAKWIENKDATEMEIEYIQNVCHEGRFSAKMDEALKIALTLWGSAMALMVDKKQITVSHSVSAKKQL